MCVCQLWWQVKNGCRTFENKLFQRDEKCLDVSGRCVEKQLGHFYDFFFVSDRFKLTFNTRITLFYCTLYVAHISWQKNNITSLWFSQHLITHLLKPYVCYCKWHISLFEVQSITAGNWRHMWMYLSARTELTYNDKSCWGQITLPRTVSLVCYVEIQTHFNLEPLLKNE